MGKETRKVITYSGVVLEKECYYGTGWRGALSSFPRPPRERFGSQEEREKHREQMSRRHHIRMVNANFEPGDLYLTLGFDAQHEVENYENARRVRDNFVRRLRYRYPDAVIFIYMGRGHMGERIHFHALVKGVAWKYIWKQWPYARRKRLEGEEPKPIEKMPDVIAPGEVFIKDGIRFCGLREKNVYEGVNCGADYTGIADYLFDHWTPEQGGHRWKMTRNAKHPEREEDTSESEEVLRQYTVDNPPPAPRGYIWVESRSTPYGYLYFKYVKEPPKRKKKRR